MQNGLKLALGCDLAAYDFKCQVLQALRARAYQVKDFGCHSSAEGEYPLIAEAVAGRVAAGEFDRGLLVCGTGQGMAMAANKVLNLTHKMIPNRCFTAENGPRHEQKKNEVKSKLSKQKFVLFVWFVRFRTKVRWLNFFRICSQV
jgi:RpiB/LacA/LacB family sugar-phosphate isomerase